MNESYELVKEFHVGFQLPASERPVLLDSERVKKRYSWMLEELDEFAEADNLVDQADAMIDLIYFALGTMVEMGVRPDELFRTVHRANMTKLWPDGKPHFREDSKIVKPEGWIDPYETLSRIIEDMGKTVSG